VKLDLLVIAAHPDDAEIGVGGTMLMLAARGKKVGIVDLTRGEMGTRGTREDRDRETLAANQVMGLALRENLELSDGRVEPTIEAREQLARILREHEPELVVAQYFDDLHPDHAACGRLAREAWYLAGLKRLAEIDGGPPAKRPRRLLHFPGHVPFEPTLVIDVGAVWAQKVELVRCYQSQLEPAHAKDRGEHFLFGADILARMETKARYFGERIGVRYGEPLLSTGPLAPQDLVLLMP
jgi:bacillithiol biosynthesis deacetylase BshB1